MARPAPYKAPLAQAKSALPELNAQERTNVWAYDSAGRLSYSIDATGAVTERVLDALGRVLHQRAYEQPYSASALSANGAIPAPARSMPPWPPSAAPRATAPAPAATTAPLGSCGKLTHWAKCAPTGYDSAGRLLQVSSYQAPLAYSGPNAGATSPTPAPRNWPMRSRATKRRTAATAPTAATTTSTTALGGLAKHRRTGPQRVLQLRRAGQQNQL